MLIKRGGEIKSGEITEKALYLNRRAFMTGAVAGAAGLALAPGAARAAAPPAAGQPLMAARNKAFDLPDAPTKFQEAKKAAENDDDEEDAKDAKKDKAKDKDEDK